MSTAETKIANFTETPNTPDSLVVGPEEAKQAGTAFTDLCNDELLQHAGQIQRHELTDGYPYAQLDKEKLYRDGSLVKVRVLSRSERLPEDHPEKAWLKDAPFEMQVRSWTGSGDSLQIKTAEYTFDDKTGTVRKTLHSPVADIKRVLAIADIAETGASEGEENSAAEDALFAELDHALEGQQLEKELGYDESILVGPEEIARLRALTEGIEVAGAAK